MQLCKATDSLTQNHKNSVHAELGLSKCKPTMSAARRHTFVILDLRPVSRYFYFFWTAQLQIELKYPYIALQSKCIFEYEQIILQLPICNEE